MPAVPFQSSTTSIELMPAPIYPEWIVEGTPQARAAELVRSSDHVSYTVVWECTAGTFDWTYNSDETIHIVEGSIILSDSGNPPRRLGAGDVVFFPKGSQVRWQVEGYVKKVAFFRKVLPNPLNPAFRMLRQLRNALRGDPLAGPMGSLGARGLTDAGRA